MKKFDTPDQGRPLTLIEFDRVSIVFSFFFFYSCFVNPRGLNLKGNTIKELLRVQTRIRSASMYNFECICVCKDVRACVCVSCIFFSIELDYSINDISFIYN